MRTTILDGCASKSAQPAAPRRVRQRSRSSPSRAVLSPPQTRQRSPSASPDRRTRPPTSPQTLPCAVGSAYFSPRPPAAPLRLVVRGPPPPPLPPPPPQQPAAPGESAAARFAARRRRVVKKLLRELVAALPLPSAPAARPSSKPVTTRTFPVVPPDVRDAAVQAITISHAESDVRQKPDDRRAVAKNEGEEWLGGVRALRDSHVRLVLRQLRHIDRLNRALDCAARSDAAFGRAARSVSAVARTAPSDAQLYALPPERPTAPY